MSKSLNSLIYHIITGEKSKEQQEKKGKKICVKKEDLFAARQSEIISTKIKKGSNLRCFPLKDPLQKRLPLKELQNTLSRLICLRQHRCARLGKDLVASKLSRFRSEVNITNE